MTEMTRQSTIIFAALLIAAGCGQQSTPTPTDASTAVTDADVGALDGGSDVARSSDAESEPSCGDSPVRSLATLEEWEVDTWVGAQVDDGSVYAAVAAGEFELPDDGASAYGATWRSVAADDSGLLPLPNRRGSLVAATAIEVDEPITLIARADKVSRVWVHGRAMPGDPYGFGDKRVPIRLDAGRNVIVVQYGHRLEASVEFFTSPDQIALNLADMTAPDLRQGTTTEQPLGVALLNLSGRSLRDVTARVLESDNFEATEVHYPALGPAAVTQIGFDLVPREPWGFKGATHGVRVQIESCDLETTYETVIDLGTVNADEVFKRTFRSPVDDSVQYYAVVPPRNFDPERRYALTLSLHGASVRARGQARAYSQRDWTYVVAPTNRRRYGFDWEEWGRLNGINALNHAMEVFEVDPARVYLTGHSMGGHGTWHLGTLFPGRFAAVAPSAGWSSFYSYSGRSRPTGAFARARAASDTLTYLSNLANRGAYILHGSADRNVPPEEGRLMRDEMLQYTDDVVYHEEEGADHWWDGPVAEGTDCVDWPPLFEFLHQHTLDPSELDFEFRTPAPWVSRHHSYVTIVASETPLEDSVVTSTSDGDSVTLQTSNVRAMTLDGGALEAKGVGEVVVDGVSHPVDGTKIELGEPGEKPADRSGPFNQVFHEPFCFVYPDDSASFRDYAAFLVSTWSIIGNGHACALPLSAVTEELRGQRNMVYVGVEFDRLPGTDEGPFSWDDEQIRLGDGSYSDAAMLTLFPDSDSLAAAMVATRGAEHLLYRYSPFSSTSGAPDYLVWTEQGGAAAGFYDDTWGFDPALAD